jgi:hypothetical protein
VVFGLKQKRLGISYMTVTRHNKSNLIDTLLEADYFETSHFDLSSKEVHQKLSCLDEASFETFQQNRDDNTSLILQEPFDYTLL